MKPGVNTTAWLECQKLDEGKTIREVSKVIDHGGAYGSEQENLRWTFTDGSYTQWAAHFTPAEHDYVRQAARVIDLTRQNKELLDFVNELESELRDWRGESDR
jgi:hypothetical protein